jgi:hypothetical protein
MLIRRVWKLSSFFKEEKARFAQHAEISCQPKASFRAFSAFFLADCALKNSIAAMHISAVIFGFVDFVYSKNN